ncbi:MAG: WG repeat-containing protein [Candidatus Obscuribacterales bacterium]|nr:WG repeat-containing protein [Candidatus Obscuribacterales bacterium]
MLEECKLRKFFARAVNFLFSVSFLIAVPGEFDPEGRFSGDGDLYGLLDQNGKSVVPPKYSQIDYAGRGLFIASSVNAHDPWVRGEERYLFNADGVQVELKVPEGSHFRRILWLGEGLQDSDVPLKILPQNTLVTFIKDNHYGICDLSGKTIVRPIYDFIDIPHDGLSFMVKTIDHVCELSTFNVQTHQVKVLPIKKPVWSGPGAFRYQTFFSEGLAACEIRDDRGFPKFGYIDVDGKFAIEPRYYEPSPFVNGIASVSLGMGKADTVIDKSGRIISPEILEVDQFRGDYAVAKYKALPAGYGIVNRKFEFVVKPDYGSIRAITKWRAYSHFSDVKRRRTEPADYYLCNHSVFSNDCRFLFELPAGCEPNFTELHEGYWSSWSGKSMYFDMSGHEISKPKSIERDDSNSAVQLVAPGRFLLTVKTDTGKFDPRYWSLGIDQPISRFEMFKRFLEEYNLIGMSFVDVAKLLGIGYSSRLDKPTPDHKTFRYHLISGGCLPEMAVEVEIHISNGKVESWCFDTYHKVASPITSNVLIVSPKGESGRIPQTIPKSVSGPQSKMKQKVQPPAPNTKP